MNAIVKATGVDGEVAALCAKNPQIVVIKTQRFLEPSQRESIRDSWKSLVAGTTLEGVKVAVLDGGLDIAIVDDVDEQ